VAVQLEIRDGDPWWMSPDIWVVPGGDPNGAPGQPIVGQENYLWSRVRNSGSTPAAAARVEFFWSNPATGVLRSNSTLVGYGYADIPAGGSTEVLCITPWVPVVVNDGHECVVAQVLHAANPLPTPLPDAFNPPAYAQVAQRNLTVVVLSMAQAQMLVLQVALPLRSRVRDTAVRIERGDRKLTGEQLRQLGLSPRLRPAELLESAGFVDGAGCTDERGQTERRFELKPGTAAPAYVRITGRRARTGYEFLSVLQETDGEVTGGISYVIVPGRERET
jgi:hypothetical protein